MDLGFGAFLEKFEENWGKRSVKALLLLIGITVALICGQTILLIALAPLIKLFLPFFKGVSIWGAFVQGAWVGLVLGAGAFAGSLLAASFAQWKTIRKLNEIRTLAKEKMAQAHELLDNAKERKLLADEAYEKSNQMLDELKAMIIHVQRVEDNRNPDIHSEE